MMINLNHVQTAEDLSQVVAREAVRGLAADRGTLFLLDEGREALYAPGTAGLFPLEGPGVASWSAFHREGVLVGEAVRDPRHDPAVDGPARSLVAVPVLAEGRLRGSLLAARDRLDAPFADGDRRLLEELAGAVGGALVTLDLRSELESLMLHGQEWIGAATDRLAPGGEGHAWRVSELARLLAGELGFAPHQVERIWLAARYHDLGWIVARYAQRWEIERYHPLAGAAALRPVSLLEDVAELVELHHERYDGSGYPGGLAESAVPLEAYVLALAEDLDERVDRERTAAIRSVFRALDAVDRYLGEPRPDHHPRVVEAARKLAGAGRLAHLYT